MTSSANLLQRSLSECGLLICIGSGGVGKTTTSASLALQAALAGRKTLVLTIDPARRLLQALGLQGAELEPNTPLQVLPKMSGSLGAFAESARLDAMMLDPERGAEEMVKRLLDDPNLHREVLGNRIYRALLPALSAAPDYVALELICDLHATGAYDLIVLDTPPAHNTMDFLEAGSTFSSFINERVIKFFSLVPGVGGKSNSLLRRGSTVAMRLLGKLFGSEVLPDIASFFYSFRDVMPRMKERNNATDALMRSPKTRFVAVTAPGETSLREAHHMHGLLRDQRLPFGGFVVNRVVRPPRGTDEGGARDAAAESIRAALAAHGTPAEAAADLAERLRQGADHLDSMAAADRAHVDDLRRLAGQGSFCAVAPQLEHDIHVLTELQRLGAQLIDSASRG